jgi:hypothetical protein
MRKQLFAILTLAASVAMPVSAQIKDLKFKFYGRIRVDAFYNSRTNQETMDGLFNLFPLDRNLDADGRDLNAQPNDYFYCMTTRFGTNITGPMLGKAKTSANLEVDFRGIGTNYYSLRIRHAFFKFNWKSDELLLGQTWHPFFGEVSPKIVNTCTGAPFQPFSRAPQLRYRHSFGAVDLTGALVWQSQFLSIGPGNTKSNTYMKNSHVPEVFVGLNYRDAHWLVGVGGEMLSIAPRTSSTVTTTNEAGVSETKTYKVSERVTSLSGEAHVQYSSKDWFVAAKTTLACNMTQASMLGGYGVTSTNERTGEQKLTPIRNSSTWLNVTYGSKWKPGVFLGYIKNLGTTKAVTSVQGLGTNIDQLSIAGAELTYNIPHWMFGVEYTATTALYGTLNKSNGRVVDTHDVTNHRVMGSVAFIF